VALVVNHNSGGFGFGYLAVSTPNHDFRMKLESSLKEVPRVGPILINRLRRLGIERVSDLIFHFPFRYDDFGKTIEIKDVESGQTVSISGVVWEIRNLRTKFGKKLTLATINDGTGTIEAVWFNQFFLTNIIKPEMRINLAGKVGIFSGKQTLTNPDSEPLHEGNLLHTKGLVPIYPETFGLSSKWIRAKLKEIFPLIKDQLNEVLPQKVLDSNNLIGFAQAVRQIHFPSTWKEVEEAKKRLAFDELLFAHLKVLSRKKEWEVGRAALPQKVNQERLLHLIGRLPFTLTRAQRKVLQEITSDLSKVKPMNRLLQGDVGSGKTVVAAICAYLVYQNGYRSALMAPTQVLAAQHFETLKSILEPEGIKVALFTGPRKELTKWDVVVGTHALLTQKITFEKLAFVVIDEQHRFGVRQRALLRSRGENPHVLTMTATPIPRSLALTVYGDLELSYLDELPIGRKVVKTYLVPPEKRNSAYQFVRDHISQGEQAFIICPLIDLSETQVSVKGATEEFKRLSQDVFPDLKLGLLHGRQKLPEKLANLKEFSSGVTQILVATPVVEVGIDVPKASIILIEGAERFGLASLHQLRGRVGRGEAQSFCLLFAESDNPKVLERLQAMQKYHLGRQLAELDLELRGPGEIYGQAQSGVPLFKIADPSDLKLNLRTKEEAFRIFRSNQLNILKDPRAAFERGNLITPD
jgi:ATP-dependent DNA helicase RecG